MRSSWRFLAVVGLIAVSISGRSFAASEAPVHPASPRGGGATTPAPTAQSELDQLFSELKNATNAEAAKSVEAAILQRFLRSGSDTVDLLMSWAIDSMN